MRDDSLLLPDVSDVPPITPGYEVAGVEAFYDRHGATYRNPHEGEVRETLRRAIRHWNLDLTKVLDLACGSGEVTLELLDIGAQHVTGIDPFTQAAYLARTGMSGASMTFADIADGSLDGQSYSLVVCSYAMHLCEQSRLAGLCLALARAAPSLLILSPHKRPAIKHGWGWSPAQEIIHERVHARLHTTITAA